MMLKKGFQEEQISFIKQRMIDSNVDVNEFNWDRVTFINSFNILKDIYLSLIVKDTETLSYGAKADNKSYDISIDYNPSSDFDYCATKQSINDSTFLFITDDIFKLLDKVVRLESFDMTKIEEFNNLKSGATIKYTIGDVVQINKKNMNQKTVYAYDMWLPIKIELYDIREER